MKSLQEGGGGGEGLCTHLFLYYDGADTVQSLVSTILDTDLNANVHPCCRGSGDILLPVWVGHIVLLISVCSGYPFSRQSPSNLKNPFVLPRYTYTESMNL